MSRFARHHSASFRAWAPSKSPFRIEYSPTLLREVQISNGGVDAFGVLYGVRLGNTIRLVAARGRTGLEPVGIFASRVRGKVFLTEEDLERFEKADAYVALVISGEKGGFFVRDTEGFIETLRSLEEFFIHAPTAPVAKQRRWPWALSLLALPIFFYRPHHPQPALTLRETAGQLRISWITPTQETLTILDGGERTYIPVGPGQSTATYARRTGDVTVGIGSAQARFVGAALPVSEIERERARVDALHHQVSMLRAARESGRTKIAELERRLQ
jgi:hypothetical protein